MLSRIFKKKDVQDNPVKFDRRATDKAPTHTRMKKMYGRADSFTSLLPWLEYSAESQCFLLDDGYSVGALFTIHTVGTEARSDLFMAELRDKIQIALTSLPEELNAPWIFQLYLQDEENLDDQVQSYVDYIHPRAAGSILTDSYMGSLQDHFSNISRTGGLFVDKLVTGNPWRGQIRRVRATLYRRRKPTNMAYGYLNTSPEDELNEIAAKFTASMSSVGVRIERCGGHELYDWMFQWFNPSPDITDGSAKALLKKSPYPGDDEMPFGADFSASLMLGLPHSNHERGIWWFDGLAHKTIVIQNLKRIPDIGLFGAERQVGDRISAVFDETPENTVLVITIIIKAQDEIRNHLAKVQKGAVGDYAEAQLAAIDAEKAVMEMAKHNKLYPVQIALYVRGDNEDDLHSKINEVNSLLLANSIQPILEKDDITALDSYIRNLPMAYNYDHDKKDSRRSRLIFSKHIANMLPLYGRSTGT